MAGFPIRVDSIADLLQLTDTMQEGRFESFMRELGGLDETDRDLFVGALADYARFASSTFHVDQVRLPVDTMISQYVLFRKLVAWRRDWSTARVLEIGPGCGYLPFFMRHRPPAAYHQIEATESFYILQHLVARWCLGDRVLEHATLPEGEFTPVQSHLVDTAPCVRVTRKAPICEHWPWWLADKPSGDQFDIVTANANLNEVSVDALHGYARLMGQSLRPNGALIVQCFGGGPTPMDEIMNALARNGFKLLFLAPPSRTLTLPNAVLIKGTWDGVPRGDATDPRVRAMFRLDETSERTVYTAAQLADMVTAKLDAAG